MHNWTSATINLKPKATSLIRFYTLLGAAFLCLFITAGQLSADESNIEQPMLNAIQIVNATKKVIFSEQRIINSPNPDGKEILFGKLFIEQIERRYKEIYAREIPYRQHPLTKELLYYLPLVNELNHTLIYDSSVKFKGVIAATYTSQLSHLLSLNQEAMHLKFTAPMQLLRNKLNSPDTWEKSVMKQFQENEWEQGKAYFEEDVKFNNRIAYRIMLPLHFSPTCLSCHGRPIDNPINSGKKKPLWTDIDVSGFTMENMRAGDFAGAISLSIFKGSFIICGDLKLAAEAQCQE